MWTITAQLTTGTYTLSSTDQVWWTAGVDNSTANYVLVGQYQNNTHVYASDGITHQCPTNHVNNTKFVDSGHVSVNGAASIALSALTPSQCGLKLVFDTTDLGGASVQTAQAKFYAYDGVTDTNGMDGVSFKCFGFSGTIPTDVEWESASGSDRAMVFADQAAATTHTYYIATSVNPTSSGAKLGKMKFSLSYV